MASILKLNGRWRAQVRRKGYAPRARTFDTKAEAEAWARMMEAQIDRKAPQERTESIGMTVADVIDAYRKLRDASRPISDSSNEHYMLKALKRGLGHVQVVDMTPQHLVEYANLRRKDGAGPYTINMDISKLGTVMRYGAVSLGVALPDVVGPARPLLSHLRLIGGGGKRERRPAEDELQRVMAAMAERRGQVYADAVAFAVATAMRRGEICAVRREEIDRKTRTVPVWRKHPRKGKVLERVPLLPTAWEIIERQPESEDGRIFPIEPGTLSKYFTEACRSLGIPDLHLHDMRHEGTSRLFEQGLDIPKVALVTGHKKWEHLKRYTQLKPEDLTLQSPATDQGTLPRRERRRSGSRPGKS